MVLFIRWWQSDEFVISCPSKAAGLFWWEMSSSHPYDEFAPGDHLWSIAPPSGPMPPNLAKSFTHSPSFPGSPTLGLPPAPESKYHQSSPFTFLILVYWSTNPQSAVDSVGNRYYFKLTYQVFLKVPRKLELNNACIFGTNLEILASFFHKPHFP